MEVVIGTMLLIGAFVLGQYTADPDAEETRARLRGEQAVELSETGYFHQGCRYRVDGPIQRDLTLPYSQRPNDGAGSDETRVGADNE